VKPDRIRDRKRLSLPRTLVVTVLGAGPMTAGCGDNAPPRPDAAPCLPDGGGGCPDAPPI
jgi:hypothetical protein